MTIANRAKETSVSTGTGNFTLDGAAAGFETFAAALAKIVAAGPWDEVSYLITMGNDYEMGRTRFTSPSTLTRDAGTLTTVLASSNSDARVDWGAGTKNVLITGAAEDVHPHIYGHAALTAGEAIGGTSTVKIFDASYTVPTDEGGWWDSATNHRLDINANCIVQLSLHLMSTGQALLPHFYVNGTSLFDYTSMAAVDSSLTTLSMPLVLDSGDYVEIYAQNTSGGSINAMGNASAPYKTQLWWRVEEFV